MEEAALLDIYNQLIENVTSKARKYRLETFENCFVGEEAVTYLVSSGKFVTAFGLLTG